jgi:uncharacterized protein YdhG (YjbR/CyaY superfamily)
MPKSNSQIKDFDSYLASALAESIEKLKELRQIILETVPDCGELINYGIPAFSLVKGGKREEQIMIAGYKKHVGFYPHSTTIEHFDDELKGFEKGKGSIQFKLEVDLPKELIIKMIAYRMKLLTT